MPLFRRWGLRILKTLIRSYRSFTDDRSSMRAAALTLYSLLSIVPVLALIFGIAKGFGLEAGLQDWLMSHFSGQQELLAQATVFAHRLLQTAQGGIVAGAGVAFLIYSVLMVIGNIEKTFNHIWSINKPRSLGRKMSDYLSLVLVGPFMVLGASSLNVYLAAYLGRFSERVPFTGLFSFVSQGILRIIPILLLWLLFTFVYVFLPNTKVRLASGLFGGALAAFLYQIVQSLYINLQIGVSRSNAVYGSFAALPLFLIWLQMSWHIVLFGAEVTHQHQDSERSEKMQEPMALSFAAIKRVGLALCERIARDFMQGRPPPTMDKLGEDMNIPSRTLADILKRLHEAGIISEIATRDQDIFAYLPTHDPHRVRPVDILEALENLGADLQQEGEREKESEDHIRPMLAAFEQALREHPENRPLSALAGPSEEDLRRERGQS